MGGGGLAFPGCRVTGSGVLGQSADRQAPDAISGGARLSSQFPFFPPSETRNAEPVHVRSPQPQAGVLGPGVLCKRPVRSGEANPAPSIQPYSLTDLGSTGESHSHPGKGSSGHRVQDKIHNLSKSLGLTRPPLSNCPETKGYLDSSTLLSTPVLPNSVLNITLNISHKTSTLTPSLPPPSSKKD